MDHIHYKTLLDIRDVLALVIMNHISIKSIEKKWTNIHHALRVINA